MVMRFGIGLLVLPLLSSCGLSCTLMYAPSLLTISINSATQDPGLYAIEVTGMGATAMCVASLPYMDGDIVSCTSNAALGLSTDGQRIEQLVLTAFSPESLQVLVNVDGEELRRVFFTPDYTVREPNGPGCGEQRLAELRMDL